MSLPSCELGVGFSTAASKWCGGVEFARILGASTLTDVAHALRELVAGKLQNASISISNIYYKSPQNQCNLERMLLATGKVLIGHGLKNDLMSLGIQHPFESMRDTANYKKFQRGDGSTYSLKQLAKHWLQKDIQSRRKRHSARYEACYYHMLGRLALQLGIIAIRLTSDLN